MEMNNIMLTNNLTNTVFFSDWLSTECPKLYQSLTKTLQDNAVDYRILGNTNDIWCRDYMPVQTDEKRFVSYKYYPNYLVEKHQEQYITNVRDVGNVDFLRQAEVVPLDLVLDGGNVVKCGNKIVMTEKVFVENKEMSHNEVQRLLEEAFRCEIVFLPWDRNEKCGHSDGIVHYIGDNRVLLTNYGDLSPYFHRRFRKALENHFEVITLKYKVKQKHKRSWAYINYLQVGNLVLVPQMDIPEDEQALEQICKVLPNCKVVGIPALEAVRKGGALNCISWNIKL
ncbi:MAG: agmatine deiminase family protein [Bacteroidales bacterium]|nr:agmatine deiminase family protein [Bacteroidales bacterium]